MAARNPRKATGAPAHLLTAAFQKRVHRERRMRTPRAAGGVEAQELQGSALQPRGKQLVGGGRGRHARSDPAPGQRSGARKPVLARCTRARTHPDVHVRPAHCVTAQAEATQAPGRQGGDRRPGCPPAVDQGHAQQPGESQVPAAQRRTRAVWPTYVRFWSVRAGSGSRYRAERRCGHREAGSSGKLVHPRARGGASPTLCTCSHSEQHSTMGVRINR